ncbi:MAG: TIGR04438 family Trp-rich protein [Burkholderiales bacterium]|nr:TIGR04438 family Trp-rich protein [Burkholderiales bacterium]
MYLLGLGLIFLVMKYFGLGPVAAWEWWWVLSPFALAVLWWSWADWSGYTKKVAMAKEDKRRQARIERNHEALGTSGKKKKR